MHNSNSVINIIPEKDIKQSHNLEFGNFYFLKNTIISEVKESVTYDWNKAQQIIKLAEEFFGPDFHVNYIANRINDYSVVAQDWIKFFKQNRKLKSFCIVTYSKVGRINLVMERFFYKPSHIHHFTNLQDALDFIQNQEEE